MTDRYQRLMARLRDDPEFKARYIARFNRRRESLLKAMREDVEFVRQITSLPGKSHAAPANPRADRESPVAVRPLWWSRLYYRIRDLLGLHPKRIP